MSDFNADASNKPQTANPAKASGCVAGVESGLGSVEVLTRGALQPEQETHGSTFVQKSVDSDAGSDNGKSFKFRY